MIDFIINVVVFILSLALLVVIHEFGHYITAKAFKVYVTEFSIGFGPALFKKEGKETTFSIRAVPLGGFCAIVGESLPEFTEEEYNQLSESDKKTVDLYKTIPEERRLDGIAKWKRAVIMLAGVTMNFILGFIMLTVCYALVDVPTVWSNQVLVEQDSIAAKAGIDEDDKFSYVSYIVTINGKEYSQSLKECGEDGRGFRASFYILEDIYPTSSEDIATYTLINDNYETKTLQIPAIYNEKAKMYQWSPVGITFLIKESRHLNFGEVIVNSGSTFGKYSITIFEALGKLFTPEGFEQTGGIISIFTAQQEVMKMEQGFINVINLWALISINLGIMNLLPFPGLDGWHFLVIAIEGITRKELPRKFKDIMSTIGMFLLFGLMILITFKDIFMLF